MPDVDYTALAAKLREQNRPPSLDMYTNEGLAAMAIYALADALDAMAQA